MDMDQVEVEKLMENADSLPFGFLVVNDQGKILGHNQKLVEICGYASGRDLPVNPDDLILPDEWKDLLQKNTPGYITCTLHLRQKNGMYCDCEAVVQKMQNHSGRVLSVLYLRPSEENAEKHTYDHVTGLYERSDLFAWINHQYAWMNASAANDHRATICMNLVGFRRLNELRTFRMGDLFLKKFGQMIIRIFDTKLVTRNFADHFIVFYAGDDIDDRLAELRQEALFLQEGFRPQIEAGIYAWNRSAEMRADLSAELAEAAMRTLKKGGKGLTCRYSDEIEAGEELDAYINDHFEEALEKGNIEVWLQPVTRSLTGKVCSFEALSRWRDSHYGMIMPGKFVPVLERKGLSWKLDLFVTRYICSLLAREGRKVPVSINFSRQDFKYFDPFTEVEEAVSENGIDRHLICIEITESTIIRNPAVIHHAIDQFHEAGYQVWMDDFGSAYSSLNILKDYDFDEMKLDMGFLHNLNDKGRTIIRSCIDMAKNTGVHTLCEGVETEEELRFLRDAGCEKIQGYCFSKPVSCAEVSRRIRNGEFILETENEAALYDSLSMQPFLRDISWCLIKSEADGTYHMLYENPRFRHTITERQLLRLSKDGLLDNTGTGLMRSLYQAASAVTATGNHAAIRTQEMGFVYETQARLLAKEQSEGLCMITIHNITVETDQMPALKAAGSLAGHEKALSENNPYFETFGTIDENPIPTVLIRLISGSTEDQDDFVYLEANEAYCRLMQRKKTDLIGRRYKRLAGVYADYGWVNIAAQCIRTRKCIAGEKTSSFIFHTLSFMAVPAEREGCCSVAVSIKEDTGKESVFRQGYAGGILNTAITRAIAVEDPETSLNELLRIAGISLKADRAYIFEYEASGDISNTYEWCREGVTPEKEHLQHVPGDVFDCTFGRTLKQRQNIMIQDMHAYAGIDPTAAEILSAQGISRLVGAPLSLENRLIGFIGIDNPPLSTIGSLAGTLDVFGAFTAALLRHRDNTSRLVAMNRQERITHDAIRKALLQKNPDAEIRELISRIGTELNASRAYVFEFENDVTVSNTYEWCNDGVIPEKDNLMHVDVSVYAKSWIEAMKKHHHILIRDMDVYAKKDPMTAEFLRHQNIDRLIASPLFLEKKFLGFIGIDNPDIHNMENTAILLDMAAGFCVGLLRSRNSFHRLRLESFYESRFNQAAAEAVSTRNPDGALEHLLAETSRIVLASRAYIFEQNGDRSFCTYLWQKDPDAIAYADSPEDLTGQAGKEGEMVLIRQNSDGMNIGKEALKRVREQGIRDLIQVPVFVDGGCKGMIGFENPSPQSMQKPYSLYRLSATFAGALLRHRDNVHRLNEQSEKDALTGAGNRRYLMKFASGLDSESPLALFYCDLNLLKQTNDLYGHQAGDRLILSLSRTLMDHCPPGRGNGVFRLGGDEFLLVLTGISQSAFQAKKEDLQKAFAEKNISTAVGAVYRPDNRTPFEKTMNEADDLMYEEKHRWHEKNDKGKSSR
jgi:diguanylate cyclase (GGDEF)-like protein